MTKTKFWRLAAPVLIPVTAGGLWPTVTSAGGTDPGPPAGGPAFTCRASVARVTTHGPLPALNVEPFVANRAGDPCVAESTGLLNDANLAGLGTASVAFARTGVSATHSTAESGVADITLGVAGQSLRAQVLTSRATASCAAGQPVLTGSSRVVGLTVNGQPVDVPADNAPADVVLPAGVVVHLNQTVTTADQVTQRALFLDSPLVDIVVAESIADVHGCPPGPGGGNDGGGKGGGGKGGGGKGGGKDDGKPRCPADKARDGTGQGKGHANESHLGKDHSGPGHSGKAGGGDPACPKDKDKDDDRGDGKDQKGKDQKGKGEGGSEDDGKGGTGGTPEKPQCSDGRDNDGDKKVDHPNDPGCSGPNDDDETDGPAGGPAFTCRASVARVTTHGPLPALNVEPFVANRAGDPCVAESTGLLNDANLAGLGTASVAFARTGVSATHSTAESGVADITLGVAGQALRAQVLTSRATASCAAGQPVLTGSSRVVGLTVNGQPVDVPADNAPADVVLPAGVVVHLNQTVTTADQVTQRALFLDSPLVDIVVAESIADVHGCPPGPGGGNDGGGKGGGGQGGKGGGGGGQGGGGGGGAQPQCSDGRDNDGDKKVDHPNDPGCSGPNDDDETDGPAAGPAFTCRASVVRVTTDDPLPGLTLEPFVANRAGDPCVAENTGLLNDADLVGLGTASGAFARTGVSATQSTAEAGVADVILGVAGQTLRARVLTSQATASCAAGQPRLTGSSQVVSLTINGQDVEIPADNAAADLVVAEGIVLHLNQTVTTTDQVTQRALFLETPLLDVVVAEAVADVHNCPGVPGNGNKKG